ncbi:MAG: hypothetical protein LBU97_04600 [Alistipes sp.]|jgi:hypothetical protein|nr:hypothetical protein [Alistipes sp.]
MFFENTTEGVNLHLISMNDEYAIGLLRGGDDTEALQKVVSAEDAELLRNQGEEDNRWLVKYTFK